MTMPKEFTSGTHRARDPEETWEIIRSGLPGYGITRIADVTRLDTLRIPVTMVTRPLGRTLSVSQGKGPTKQLAALSGCMEAIEFWHAEEAVPPPGIVGATARDLSLPYDLNSLHGASAALVGDRTPLDWLAGIGLVSGAEIPIPRQLVELSETYDESPRGFGMKASSNGLASGNNKTEALLHALYELVERDALAVLRRTADSEVVDLSSVGDELCAELIERIAGGPASIEVRHVPNRWSLPVFVAEVWSEDFPVTASGSGCHSSASVALSRAITEAAQSRLTMISGSRDDLAAVYEHIARGKMRRAAIAEGVTWAGIIGRYAASPDDMDVELRELASQTQRVTGREPVGLDLSTDPAFAVVRAYVCGAELIGRHQSPRTAPA